MGGSELELVEMEVEGGGGWGRRKGRLDSGENTDIPKLSNYTFSAECSSCLIRRFFVPH